MDVAEVAARSRRYMRSEEALEGSTPRRTMWKAYDADEGVEVAMHVMPLRAGAFSDPSGAAARASLERGLGSDLQHAHVLRVLDTWVERVGSDGGPDDWQLCLVTPIVSAYTLHSYIARIDDVRQRVVRKWCRQILSGLEYLHSLGRAHGDIRLGNVFIDGQSGNVLLGTLRVAALEHADGAAIAAGDDEALRAALYEPPNTPAGGMATFACDVWAFGLCLLEISTRRVPYGTYTHDTLAQLAEDKLAGVLPKELSDIDAKIAQLEDIVSRSRAESDSVVSTSAPAHNTERIADLHAMRDLIVQCVARAELIRTSMRECACV